MPAPFFPVWRGRCANLGADEGGGSFALPQERRGERGSVGGGAVSVYGARRDPSDVVEGGGCAGEAPSPLPGGLPRSPPRQRWAGAGGGDTRGGDGGWGGEAACCTGRTEWLGSCRQVPAFVQASWRTCFLQRTIKSRVLV